MVNSVTDTPGLESFPDVSGEWDMAIHWSRDGQASVLVASALIRQEGEAIDMTVRSTGSDSHTILVKPGRDPSGNPLLYYMYEVEPRSADPGEALSYRGAAILRSYSGGRELSGNYWTSRRSTGTFRLTRRSQPNVQAFGESALSTDVLLVTALKEEFDAAILVFSQGDLIGTGVCAWTDLALPAAAECKRGVFMVNGSPLYDIVVARPPRMGGIHTGLLAAALGFQLKPGCMVMCGVCAGNPNVVALGDVVVSELAYQHDQGRSDSENFVPDHRQVPISKAWKVAAEALVASRLPSYGAASSLDARFWLLERLYGGDDPAKHPAMSRYFARGEWVAMVEGLMAEGIIRRDGVVFQLTASGRDEVESSMAMNVDPPERLPIAIKLGPIASGNAVVKDGVTWEALRDMGVRSVVALEMEAAALAFAAHDLEIPEWIVIKGVMDHAGPRKDDRFKLFAARASAEALCAFLIGRFSEDRP